MFVRSVLPTLRLALLALVTTVGPLACSGGAVGGGSAAADAGTGKGSEVTNTNLPASRVVFVTRVRIAGYKIGGREGADDKCQTYANAAGLSGAFQAWISTETEDAIDRVPDGGPWHAVGRTEVVFANRSAWQGYPRSSLAYDESGTAVVPTFWTGTEPGGFRTDACGDWSDAQALGVVGNGQVGDEKWTQSGRQQCAFSASLLCYQRDW